MSRHQFDLPVVVDRAGRAAAERPARRGSCASAMNDGRRSAGERLPSSRALAAALGVSRTVVTAAYEQLYAEGWLEGRHGSGTYVADIAARPAPCRDGGTHSRTAGRQPAGREVDRPAARHALGGRARHARVAPRLAAGGGRTAVGAAGPHGLPGLRPALVDYLRRSRGVACPPERVLVTRGVTNGLRPARRDGAAARRPGRRRGARLPQRPAVLRGARRGGRAVPGGRARPDGRRAPRRPARSSTPRRRTSTRWAGGCRCRAGRRCSPGRGGAAR